MNEHLEVLKAKRAPINSCADLSRSMRGRRYGILYFTEEFRIDFENKMCGLNRIKELEEQNKQLTDAYLIQKDLINAEFLSDYVSKDKIREKIEEYLQFDRENKTYTKDGRENFSMQYFYARALEELLKEE